MYHSGGGGTSPHSYCFVSVSLEKGRGIPKKQSLPGERAKGEGKTEGLTDGRWTRWIQTERGGQPADRRQCGRRGLGGVQADPDGEGLTTPAPRLGPRYLPLPFPPPPPTMAVLLSLGPDKRASSAEGWPVARPQTLLGGR